MKDIVLDASSISLGTSSETKRRSFSVQRLDIRNNRLFAVGLVWGLVLNFAQATSWAAIVDALIILLMSFLIFFKEMRRKKKSIGLNSSLIAPFYIFIFFSILSSFSELTSLSETITNIMLLPTIFSLTMICRSADDLSYQEKIVSLRRGFTAASFILVCFFLFSSEWTQLTNSSYRVSGFVNSNTIGYVAGFCAISLLEEVRLSCKPVTRALCILSFIACVALIVFTKSRTSLVTTSVGFIIYIFLSFNISKFVLFTVFTLTLIMGPLSESISSTWLPENRPLETLAGRGRAWTYLVNDVIPNNLLIGTGPGSNETLTEAATGISSAHNALLRYLTDVGLLGTLPLLYIIIRTSVYSFRHRKNKERHVWIAFFMAALVHSLAEQSLFGMGSCPGVLFLLSLVVLNSASTVFGRC